MLKIRSVEFLKSIFDVEDFTHFDKPVFAFIGRSNVGKSSLINAILQRKRVAYVSSTPGKTQSINLFLINQNFYLADLPGYGFAKLPKKHRDKWDKLIQRFLQDCNAFHTIFLLIDIRIPPQKMDLMMHEFFSYYDLPVKYIFTKADKLTKNQTAKQTAKLSKAYGLKPGDYICTSVTKKNGIDQVQKIFASSAGS